MSWEKWNLKTVSIYVILALSVGVFLYVMLARIGYRWHWEDVPPNLDLLFKAMLLTLRISIFSIFFGIIIGLIAGIGRISKNIIFNGITTIYVELIRGTPLLVQILIMYYFVGTLLQLSSFVSGVVALSLFSGAYVAEIVRAGIQSIHRGQMEAARSLGMTYIQAMRYIILPQAFKRILPPLAGQFISLIKDSSLVSVIALPDLVLTGRQIVTRSFRSFEIWFTVAGFYLVMTLSLSLVVRYLERRMATSD